MSDRLFVYGTLMQAAQHERHALLAPHGRFAGDGKIQAKLYLVSDYPGVILSSDVHDIVHGEVYEIADPDTAFGVLDDYEECSSRFVAPTQYLRQRVSVHLTTGEVCEAWTYVYNWAVEHLKPIPSGRFSAAT